MYITRTDIEKVIPAAELAQLLDRNQDGAEDAGAAVWIASAIAAAVSQIHSLLTKRYQLPLSEADSLLMEFIKPGLVDLAWAALYPRADMAGRDLKERGQAFIERLTDIRDGKADLPATTGTPASGPAAGVLWSAAVRKTTGGMP